MSAAEQAAFTQERDITTVGQETLPTANTNEEVVKGDTVQSQVKPDHKEAAQQPDYDSLKAIGYLILNLKPLTGLLISFLNGFLAAGESELYWCSASRLF